LKNNWMKNFVEQGGLSHLFETFNYALEDYLNSTQISLMNNICLELLIKIIKIFYSCSFMKYDYYKYIIFDNNINFDYNFSEIQDLIWKIIDYKKVIDNLIKLISLLTTNYSGFSDEEELILQNAFEFFILILTFIEDANTLESILLGENLKQIIVFGVLNKSPSIKNRFTGCLVKLCKMCNYSQNFKLLGYVFAIFLSMIQQNAEGLSIEFFNFFATIFEDYLNCKDQLDTILEAKNIKISSFIFNIANIVFEEIRQNGKSTIETDMLIGYIKILQVYIIKYITFLLFLESLRQPS